DTRVDLLGQLQAALVVEGLGFVEQLLVDLEVAGGDVIHQDLAEALQGFAVGGLLRFAIQGSEGGNQFVTLLQPAVDQEVDATPAFLGVLTALEHDGPHFPDYSLLLCVCSETVFRRSVPGLGKVRRSGNFPSARWGRVCPLRTPIKAPLGETFIRAFERQPACAVVRARGAARKRDAARAARAARGTVRRGAAAGRGRTGSDRRNQAGSTRGCSG